MVRLHLKWAWRALLAQKGYTLINIVGLSLGIACCLLIILYLRDELSYDRYHEEVEQVHRVIFESKTSGINDVLSSPPLAEAIQQDFPQVAHATRLYRQRGVCRNQGKTLSGAAVLFCRFDLL